jgi:hypothetical protein
MPADETGGAFEVLLRQGNTKIECRVTWLDESTSEYDLRSLSMHHAKREITASLVDQGFWPVDRWSTVHADAHETIRHFKRMGPNDDRLRLPLVR